MIKEFDVNIWELINIEDLNNLLERDMEENNIDGIPSDIGYDCIKITEDGVLTIKSGFELENIE